MRARGLVNNGSVRWKRAENKAPLLMLQRPRNTAPPASSMKEHPFSPLGDFVIPCPQICQTFLALYSPFSLLSNRSRWHRVWQWGMGSGGHRGPLIRRSLMDTYCPSVATAWVCLESLWTLVYDQERYKRNKVEIKKSHWKFCNPGQRCEWRRNLTRPGGVIRTQEPYVKEVCGLHQEEHLRLQHQGADFPSFNLFACVWDSQVWIRANVSFLFAA